MKERVLAIIEANPGVSGRGIRLELLRTSRGTRWYWFGLKAWRMWTALEDLEEAGLVRGEWSPPDIDGLRRRHYWANSP